MTRCLRGLALLLPVAVLGGCAPSDEESAYFAQRALLLRQNAGIRELIAEAERGSLVPADRFLIGVDETLVGDIFRSQLPLERPIGKHFMVRLVQAQVSFRDKYGLVVMDGVLFRPATPQRTTAVRIHGGLGDLAIDPTTGLMSIAIAIDHIELMRVGILEGVIGRTGKKLLAKRGRELLQEAIPRLEIPVVVAQNLRIPAIQESGVQLDSLEVPLNLSVERVLAAGGKLWVTVDAQVGEVTGGEEGLGVAIRKKRKATTAAREDSAAGATTPKATGAKKGGA